MIDLLNECAIGGARCMLIQHIRGSPKICHGAHQVGRSQAMNYLMLVPAIVLPIFRTDNRAVGISSLIPQKSLHSAAFRNYFGIVSRYDRIRIQGGAPPILTNFFQLIRQFSQMFRCNLLPTFQLGKAARSLWVDLGERYAVSAQERIHANPPSPTGQPYFWKPPTTVQSPAA